MVLVVHLWLNHWFGLHCPAYRRNVFSFFGFYADTNVRAFGGYALYMPLEKSFLTLCDGRESVESGAWFAWFLWIGGLSFMKVVAVACLWVVRIVVEFHIPALDVGVQRVVLHLVRLHDTEEYRTHDYCHDYNECNQFDHVPSFYILCLSIREWGLARVQQKIERCLTNEYRPGVRIPFADYGVYLKRNVSRLLLRFWSQSVPTDPREE